MNRLAKLFPLLVIACVATFLVFFFETLDEPSDMNISLLWLFGALSIVGIVMWKD